MFPPADTTDPQVLVRGLWESLQRAGGHFGHEAIIRDEEQGQHVALFFADRLPEGASALVRGYIKSYVKACGWTTSEMKLTGRYLAFNISRRTGTTVSPPTGAKT